MMDMICSNCEANMVVLVPCMNSRYIHNITVILLQDFRHEYLSEEFIR